jgi:hypothetical protein
MVQMTDRQGGIRSLRHRGLKVQFANVFDNSAARTALDF